jgi:hypothetical protein
MEQLLEARKVIQAALYGSHEYLRCLLETILIVEKANLMRFQIWNWSSDILNMDS